MKKHFEVFHNFIESLNFKFSSICLSETWLQLHEISDSKFQLTAYYRFQLTREKNQGRRALYFLYKKFLKHKTILNEETYKT